MALCALVALGAFESPMGFAASAQPGAAIEPAVLRMLQRYETALESLDPDAVRKVHPSVRTESLARAFREMRELKVDIDEVRVLSVDKEIARVSCRVQQTLTPRIGSTQTSTVNRVLRLRRQADQWVIDGFER